MKQRTAFAIALSFISPVSGFISPKTSFNECQVYNVNSLQQSKLQKITTIYPVALEKQRKSMANIQTMGLFGLGGPEIVIILVAAAFLLGPEKLAELGKEAGKMSAELKDVPKEFQKGLDEGEIEARSKKAKIMEIEDN